MCHKCEAKNNLHIQYMQERNLKSMPKVIKNPIMYSFLMGEAENNTRKMLDQVGKDNYRATEKDISLFSLVAEKRALDFAQYQLGKIHLEKDAALAKEIENFRAALTLIQSKAILSGDSVIEKIAKDALDKEEYKFTQSSQELRAMLNEDK